MLKVCVQIALFCGLVLGAFAVHSADAQPLGTFSWQMQPYCNRVTFAVTHNSGVFTLDGVDDQCGLKPPASVVGTAIVNPSGSVTMGFSIVTSDSPTWLRRAGAVQVDATIDLATLNGTWTDSSENQGTFAFGAAAAGNPRPSPTLSFISSGGFSSYARFGGGSYYALAFSGTADAPEAMTSGNTLGRFGAGGFNGASFWWPSGQISMLTTESWSPGSHGTQIQFSTTPNGSHFSMRRMVLDQNGFLGIGTLTPDDLLDVDGDIRVGTSGTNGCLKNDNGGTIIGTCASDERFKRDVVAYSNVLPRVAALRPVTFSWRTEAFPDRGFGAGREAGLIAQEVETLLPELVSTDADGYKRVNYSRLPLLAIQAIKELKEKNDVLEQRNAALEERLVAIEEQLQHVAKETIPR